ncbi:MAG TPA: hypothetical protein VFT12_01600, partial [Thermoanaerobaculia bacterium]|nr:hypothetical protein [Thermoanaerobaculia bacterium]
PYSPEQERMLDRVIGDMNDEDLAFVIHVGDLQVSPAGYREGVPPCTDEALLHVRTLLEKSRHPIVITPGDNDWTDCHQTKPPADPSERLHRLRDLLFTSRPTLGRTSMAVASQASGNDALPFPENLSWTRNNILFVTLHIVGSNNNQGRTAEGDAESAARTAAAIAWMKKAFAAARSNGHAAVVILTHANPYFEDRWPPFYTRLVGIAPPPPARTGFTEFLAALEEEVIAYGRPVLFAHGDSHYFRVDKPFFRASDRNLIANFTRVESFGSPYVDWVRIGIDPSDPAVFTFAPQMTR